MQADESESIFHVASRLWSEIAHSTPPALSQALEASCVEWGKGSTSAKDVIKSSTTRLRAARRFALRECVDGLKTRLFVERV